jgi:flagella basal body P-ring formation protein FlgA
MILRPFIAALATALLAGNAFAAPVLKGQVVVTAAVVTVGDMFDAAGILAEQALFRAPAPGTTGSVPLPAVAAAAARIGIDNFDANGLQAVSVRRQASIIDQPLLTKLITQDLTRRGILTTGMGVQLQFSAPLAPIAVAASAAPATLLNLRYLPLSGEFTARFTLAGVAEPLDLGGTIDLTIEAPHLATHLAAGTILTPADIVMRPISAKYAETAGFADPSQLVGMQLNRQSREGMLLKPSDVSTPALIARNDLVTIYFRQGPMTLTVKGQALTNAVTGAPVQVLNLMSKRVITAKALAAGAVEVSTDPLAVAGL